MQAARLRDGSRRITHITEVLGMEGDVIITQDLFLYDIIGEDPNGNLIGRHRSTGIGRPRFWDRARYYDEEKRLAEALETPTSSSEADGPSTADAHRQMQAADVRPRGQCRRRRRRCRSSCYPIAVGERKAEKRALRASPQASPRRRAVRGNSDRAATQVEIARGRSKRKQTEEAAKLTLRCASRRRA